MLRAVHQHGTVTAAAAALHLTPSAVSHHLRELARELRVTLIEPQGRGIRLTGAAHLVIEHGDALLARWEEAESALDAYREGRAGLLRLCGFPSAVSGLIAPAMPLLRERHPGLRVQVTEAETAASFDLLLSTDADIAVLAPSEDFPHPSDSRFDQQPLLEEPLDLIVPAGHPLAARGQATLADTANEDWVLPMPGSCDHYQRVLVFCAVAGFSPRIAHWAKEWHVVSAMVCHGLGVSLFPRLTEIPASHATVRVPLTGEPVLSRRILTCVRQGSRTHPLVAHGLRALAEVAAAGPAGPGRPAASPPPRPAPEGAALAEPR
ncbi:LysR family transcriptional regulator [Streptomyces hoynatensis]|uniref:LysR family transcriptional regulator n=1 Tax=Streptomyces hoynatensis TaxID=1141874 RepID=A0A3A9YLJ4_9ACTN|nr:LysR family transcriptional regulator [Streptomyces hoynatensis]